MTTITQPPSFVNRKMAILLDISMVFVRFDHKKIPTTERAFSLSWGFTTFYYSFITTSAICKECADLMGSKTTSLTEALAGIAKV